jgi:hypothetical protein
MRKLTPDETEGLLKVVLSPDQGSTPAQRVGYDFHRLGFPVNACGNLEEVRGWLQSANEQEFMAHQATQEDHKRLVADVMAALREASKP